MSGTTLLNIETLIGSLGQVNASAPVTLGTLTLNGVEVPSLLRVGGDQGLVIHKLVGGDRIIQATGSDPTRLTLAGMFTGQSALARAQTVASLRDAGRQIAFAVSGIQLLVRIASFSYDITNKTAVIPYTLVLEVQPTTATTSSTTPSALSALVGPDIASGIQSVTSTVAQAATYAGTVIGQAQAIVGQVTPLASLLGAGGTLAGVENNLQAAGALAGAGVNLGSAPAAASGIITELQGVGTSLTGTIGQAGANLEGLSAAAGPGNLVADMPSLMAAIGSAGAASAAVTAGGYVNRALVNVQQAAGVTTTAALVHS